MFNKFTFFMFVIILTLILIEFNTDYKLVNKFPLQLQTKNLGKLFIVTHDYEHKDIFITFKQFSKINEKFYMLFADKTWNYLLEPLRPKNIEFLYVKEKTVEKISSKLLLGNNVIMFLYKESDSTGPFYILKNTKSPLSFIKIKRIDKKQNNEVKNHYNSSFSDIYINNFMSKFSLEYKNIKYKLSKLTNCTTFMKQLKNNLYL